jgi:GT2 family glycosyltransferase
LNLSILIVSYNSRHYLADCLESIARFAPAGTEVILADNASSDGSVEFVSHEYPWVSTIQLERNLGFSAANNLAAKKARGNFLLLLNPDTVLLEPISPALNWLESHKEYALLTINMLNAERAAMSCTGKFPSPLRLIALRSMLNSPTQFGDGHAHDVDWVQGSFLLVRAEQWMAVGGLDENYFMYVEDVDFCKRIRDRGWKCAYLPQISYIHSGGFNPRRFSDQVRGLHLHINTHMKGPRKLISWSILCAGCLVRAFLFRARMLLTGNDIVRLKSTASWLAFKALLERTMPS